jgi:putative spermidine/putrescine transport system substrate-binding protein
VTTELNILHSFKPGTTRRALIQSLLAIGAGGTSLLQFAEAVAQASAADVASITVLSQPGTIPDLVRESTFPPFAKDYPKTEVKLEVATNAVGYPRMLTQRNNPVISGGMFNDVFTQRGRSDDMWVKMDPAFTPNQKKLAPGMSTAGGFGFPFQLQPWGIMYNPDRVEEPKSWSDLWSDKLVGKVVMWDAYYDAYIIAAHIAGKGMSVEEGIKLWAPHKANIGAWVNSPVVSEDLVSRGEMLMAPHWGANTAQAMAQGKKLAFTIPKEGGVQWTGHAESCAGFSPAVTELTQRYLNTWLSDEVQMTWITKGFFSPASAAVSVPDNLKNNPVIISADQAMERLIRPDFVTIGPEMPRLTQMIQRTLKG